MAGGNHFQYVLEPENGTFFGVVSILAKFTHNRVRHSLKRFVSDAPYLIQQAAIAPDITGSGVLLEVQGLRSCPLDWDLASMGDIVLLISQVT